MTVITRQSRVADFALVCNSNMRKHKQTWRLTHQISLKSKKFSVDERTDGHLRTTLLGRLGGEIFAFFSKTIPYGKIFQILFRKFSSQHRSTLLCSNFMKFGRREIVRCLLDKKFRYCIKQIILAADAFSL